MLHLHVEQNLQLPFAVNLTIVCLCKLVVSDREKRKEKSASNVIVGASLPRSSPGSYPDTHKPLV